MTGIADRTDRASARDRKRIERARREAGEDPYRLSLRTPDVIEALLASGVLSEGEALRRQCVEAALAAVLHEWAGRWRR
jgi:hypothetical protein